MKKLVLFAALAVFVFTTASAQEIAFGAKAGVNFATVNGDDVEDVDGRTAFQIGAVANIPISELFAVQPEVVYSAQGFTIEETVLGMTFEGTGKLDYINIPVLADFTIAEGLSLQGGPQLGILVTDEFEVEGETESLDAESIDFGAALGAQYKLPMGLFFQARYTVGLTDIDSEANVKNSVLSICAGWFFN